MNTVREEKIIDQIENLLRSPWLPGHTRKHALERIEVNIKNLIAENISVIAGGLSIELSKLTDNSKLTGIINLEFIITEKVNKCVPIFNET